MKEEQHWRNRPGYPDIAALPTPQVSHKFKQTLLLSEKSYKDLKRLKKELLVQLKIVAGQFESPTGPSGFEGTLQDEFPHSCWLTGSPRTLSPPISVLSCPEHLVVKKVVMEREEQYLWVIHKSGHCTSSTLWKTLWFFLPILKQGHACHYASYHRWNTQMSKSQMPKPYLFEGMNIGLIKFTPSPAKHFLFTFINLPFTTTVSRLLQSGNNIKGECTVVHGIKICHQHGDFWGEKHFSSTDNKWIHNAKKLHSLLKKSCKLPISATLKHHQVSEISAPQPAKAITF